MSALYIVMCIMSALWSSSRIMAGVEEYLLFAIVLFQSDNDNVVV